MDLKVLVRDVSNDTARTWEHGVSRSWVCLDVHCLEWVVEVVVLECHISHAVVLLRLSDSTNSHADSKPNVTVANYNVL